MEETVEYYGYLKVDENGILNMVDGGILGGPYGHPFNFCPFCGKKL